MSSKLYNNAHLWVDEVPVGLDALAIYHNQDGQIKHITASAETYSLFKNMDSNSVSNSTISQIAAWFDATNEDAFNAALIVKL